MATEDAEWERSKISNQDMNLLKRLGFTKKKDSLRFPHEESYPKPPIEYRVSFVDHLIRGLSPPIHEFLRGLLFVYGLQLHQLTPNSILHVSIFITLCECFLGVQPNWALWKRIFCLRRNGSHGVAYNIGGVVICVRSDVDYFDVKFPDSVQGWRKRWLYVHEESSDSMEYNIAPFDGKAKILRRRSWDAEASEEEKLATEALMTRIRELQSTRGKELSGIQITAYFLRIRMQPLQARKNPLWMYAGDEDVERLSTDLSAKDLEKLIRRISKLSKKDTIPSSCKVTPFCSANPLPEKSATSFKKENETEVSSSTRSSLPAASPKGKRKRDEAIDSGASKANTSRAEKTAPNAEEETLDLYGAALVSSSAPTIPNGHRDLESERSKISNQDMNLLKRLGFTKKKDSLHFPHEESYPKPPIEYRVSFVDHLIRGLSPPIHEFLRGLLFVYGLQLHQLTPNSILHVSIFITLCECFLGVQPNWALWKRIFCLRRNGSHGVAYNIGGVVICVRSDVDYFDVKFPDSVQGWSKRWLYVHEESSDSMEYNIAPFDGKAKILRRRSWDAEASEEEKLATEALMTRIRELQSTRGKELSGIQITAYFLRIRMQPLQARKNPLWMYAGDEDVERLSTDLSAKDLEKLIRRISKLSKKDTIPSSCKVTPFCSANPLPELHQLTPNSILHVSIFITLCECFLGVQPNWALWKRIFCLRRNGSHGVAYNIGGVVICVRSDVDYFDVKFPDSVQGWRKRWLYVHEESSDSMEYNIAPFDGKAKILRRRSWDAEASEEEKLATEALMTRIRELQSTRGKELSGIQITAYFLRIRMQPLQARKNPLWMYAGDEDVERLSTDLSAKDLEKLIRRISKLSKKDTIPSSCKVTPFCSANPLPEPFMKELVRFGTQFIGYRDYAGELEEKLAEANKRADALAIELEQSESAHTKTVEDLQKRLDDAKRALEENVAQHSAREEEISRLETQSRRFVRRTHQEYELENPEDDELLDALSLLEIHGTEARNGLDEAEAGLSRLFPYFFHKKEEPAVFIDLAKCFTGNEDLGLQLRQEGLKVGVEGTMALIAESQQQVDWSKVGDTGKIETKKWQSLIKAAKPNSKKILATLGYKPAPAPSSSKPEVK
ncbi:hypothetical protein QYE76_009375 [Lolium multiflorum]|uniref:Transposase (putative) gypsy type domain-containing protein n=1 Tax=Lolium multiflorum TaxID=4521 RepID=A0AAD8TUW8_LOLMU|nr:hypothetical protein QYE76_009375 [Lolium multiflorum]